MRIKFQVDDHLAFGEISPRLEDTSYGTTYYGLCIKFEAAPAIATRIQRYIDTLGKMHKSHSDACYFMGKDHSINVYSGSDDFVAKFYQRLGLNLPALVEGKEPSLREVVHFVHPPVAVVGGASAGAAAAAAVVMAAPAVGADLVDFKQIRALYKAYDAALDAGKIATSKATSLSMRAHQLRNTHADAAVIREAEAAFAAQDAICQAQDAICEAALLLIADHMPTIAVPVEGAVVASIDS